MSPQIRIVLLAPFFILPFMDIAHAEGGCPPGQYPQVGQGWRACVPSPDLPAQSEPREVWVNRWQAIATDAAMFRMGAVTDKRTKDIAINSAVVECKRKGGLQCEVNIVAANSCIAMVVGSNSMTFEEADTIDDAAAFAMLQCNSKDKECRSFYSACSMPERLR